MQRAPCPFHLQMEMHQSTSDLPAASIQSSLSALVQVCSAPQRTQMTYAACANIAWNTKLHAPFNFPFFCFCLLPRAKYVQDGGRNEVKPLHCPTDLQRLPWFRPSDGKRGRGSCLCYQIQKLPGDISRLRIHHCALPGFSR